MGKIKPKKKKTEKKRKIFTPGSALALFVIFIMVGSAIGFVMMGSPTGGRQGDRVYEDYAFSMTQGGYWITEYENRYLRFHNLPGEVKNIELPDDAIESISNAGLVTLTFHPEDDNIEFIESTRMELEEQLQRELGIMVQAGVLENVTPYEDMSVVDCESANPQNIVIKMETKDEQSISFENNCLHLKGHTGNSFYRMKDRLVYTLTGIIED